MLGYYKDETLTKSVLDEDGWFHTGDVGHVEKETFLMVTDRKKEIFKLSNGKFVAPQPIESHLKESLFIDQVMVIGEHQKFASAILVPDFKYLEEWCASRNLPENLKRDKLICLPEVLFVINAQIKKINKILIEQERIHRIRIVPDE